MGDELARTERIRVWFFKDLYIEWDWNDLLRDAETSDANVNLAIAGLILSNNVEISARTGETVLRQLGFDDIRSDYYLLSSENRNRVSDPARTFAHRLVEKDGKDHHIFCAVIKGTTTLPDCITDIKSVNDGFYEGGRNCADSLKEYIDSFDGACKENTVLFITGHSLGASVANVTGRLSREFVSPGSEFVYTFASPNYETDGEQNDGKLYSNFHYYSFIEDIVPKVPLSIPPKYFTKIGHGHLFDLSALKDEQKLRFQRVYEYFRGTSFEDDKDLLGLGLRASESMSYKALKRHLCHTYMSFILSELPDSEISLILGPEE